MYGALKAQRGIIIVICFIVVQMILFSASSTLFWAATIGTVRPEQARVTSLALDDVSCDM